jgi:Pectate lyase superfamily protein
MGEIMKSNFKLVAWLFALIPALLFGNSSLAEVNPKLYSDAVRADLASTATSAGAALVSFIQSGGGSVPRTVLDKQRVSVKDFGAVGDCVADDTVALAAANLFLSTKSSRYKLAFPSGCYKYSVSPNWAISYAQIEAQGEVRLRYTGKGNAVIIDGGSELVYGVQMGRFIVEAPSSAQNGVYVRSVHHSKLGFNVRGAGAKSAALNVQFAVVTDFDNFTASVNEGGWYLGAKPLEGIKLAIRNPGETVSYCLFTNTIIEGVHVGIDLLGTLGNVFIGGTSEGNTLYGVLGSTSSSGDKFFGMDFEANSTADVYSQGKALELYGCDSTKLIAFGSLASGCSIFGGRHTSILFDTGSKHSSAINTQFNRTGFAGTFVDAGENSFISNVLNIGEKARYLTGILVVSSTSISPNSTATFVVTVVGAVLGDRAAASHSVDVGGLLVTANVTAIDKVTVNVSNITNKVQKLNSGVIKVEVNRS